MSFNASFEERLPLWAEIDESWYHAQRHGIDDDVRARGRHDLPSYHEAFGAAAGLSPNTFFDEGWYRAQYPDVTNAIEAGEFASGFEHYCCGGFRTRSPHWLFCETRYRRLHAGYTDAWLDARAYPNGYAHFLSNSTSQTLTGSLFFDPIITKRGLDRVLPPSLTTRRPYMDFLKHQRDVGEIRTSWFFDPKWYILTYPQVAEAISEGVYASAIHHYLTNATPNKFNPQEAFDEDWYCTTYPDVVPALRSGLFRNAYAHFVQHGAYEGRLPRAEVNLQPWLERYRDLDVMADETVDHPFRQWISRQDVSTGDAEDVAPLEEAGCRALFAKEAARHLPIILQNKLDFRYQGAPEISVILVMHNQVALTVQTLSSLRANYGGALDVILVDSASGDLSQTIENYVRGVQVIRYGFNIGFLQGANAALELVKAPFCLYINNDIRLFPNAINCALERLNSADEIGAVGAKIVRTHMRLQEAGSIIWRNGATYGYRRQDDPTIGEVNFARDVDYCSAAFLMVRTADARALDGFDTTFVPAYFEDTDFCLRLLERGKRIVYDPSVVIEHMESGSFGAVDSHEWVQINHSVFAQRHRNLLRGKPPPHVRNAVLGRELKRGRESILFIEDRLPMRNLGSGYVRSNEVIRAMSKLGYQVSVFPMMDMPTDPVDLAHDYPDDVELLKGWHLARFAEFVEERAGYYDVLWICRTHNLARLLPVITEYGRYLPMGRVVLDTEVIDTPRSRLKAQLESAVAPRATIETLIADELSDSHFCQQIVSVSEAEADLVRMVGYEHVSVLGHALVSDPTRRPFSERKDFLFVGALHSTDAPNYDSLAWLISEVLPLLASLMDHVPQLTIAGHIGPGVDLRPWRENPHVRCVGPLDDLRPIYDSHRVFVAPTRYAGGLPYKLHEAASYGIPAVTSSLLADQVGWKNGEAILSAPTDDPLAFAKQMVALYSDEACWARVRIEALAHVSQDCDPKGFAARLKNILRQSVTLSQTQNDSGIGRGS